VNNIITVKNLTKNFGRKVVLNNLDLRVPKGEFLTIFGPNGAGKTTLIKVISTLTHFNSGEVEIGEFDIKEDPLEIRKIIGVISHNLYLYDELTAKENLSFYGKMYSYPREKLGSRITKLLQEIGLQHRMNDRVGTFSRGMKQRLSIARAIFHNPKILFLDEPYTGLDQHATQILTGILKDLQTGSRTIIMTTHNIEQGFKLCDRVAILSRGKISFDKPKKVLTVSKFKKTYHNEVGGS
jgi:ABC-2 type transport system ATP-binding protein/heme exporter protein A